MAIRITIINEKYQKHDYLYKTLGTGIFNVVEGEKIKSCRIDIDVKSKKDIERVHTFLRSLSYSMEDES